MSNSIYKCKWKVSVLKKKIIFKFAYEITPCNFTNFFIIIGDNEYKRI